ncbi:spore coat biosynthesis protein F [Leptospira barantonii]|uniref:Spore coat biosynthesis protein F n=1 Tax=Leptospira barantonii TaxID=2023184 RepID=A0A5F2BD05_9LEPT|nr:glycosyltransferase family protein [Leptospira barantonii]TGM03446.1 spore coat biosynthesis protein F [Leptospira barantonii]
MSGTHSTRKIYAFVQARTGSTRLPGKVLKEFPPDSGKTLVDRIQERIRTVLPEEQIVYLIPEEDEELRSFLKKRKYQWFAGNLLDVRKRYLDASEFYKAESILRLTGDNPFYDTLHLDQLLQTFIFSKLDLAYVTGLPLGMGGEIFTRDALRWAPNVLEERHREHVSLHIKENPDRFEILKISSLLTEKEKEILPKLRLTIDEPKDFETTSAIFHSLNKTNPFFGAKECIELYEKDPNIFSGNQDVEQIRFQTPQSGTEKKSRIGFVVGNPKEFGSGHFERSRILFALLSSSSKETIWLSDFPNDGEIDLLIVDSRDIPVPEYSKTKVLLLDHFGPERKKYGHYDLLPHPENRNEFSLDQILIAPALRNVERKSNPYILCYAGNIGSDFTKELDSFLSGLIAREEQEDHDRKDREHLEPTRIIRVGGVPTNENSIQFVPRVSRFEFQNLLACSSGFVGYFGQSLFEAVFLNKKVCTFSIGPVHSSLSSLCEKEYGIPFTGELGSNDFGKTSVHGEEDSRKSSGLRSASSIVGGNGYSLLLRKIEEFLHFP